MKTIVSNIRVNPNIVSLLGDQLVSDRLTAISELVKNSYDADADKVTIRFSSKRDSIVVEDDGNGMSLNDIRTGWLEIGSANKRRRTRSPLKRRVMVGSMGIGRLAAFSLANAITTETGGERGPWRRFSLDFHKISSAKDLSETRVRISTLRKKPIKKGTIITLLDLKWWPEDFQEVRRRLSALSSPSGIADFEIWTEWEGSLDKIGLEEDLPVPPLTLSSKIDRWGHVTTTVRADEALYDGTLATREWKTDHDGQEYRNLRNVALQVFWYPLGERPGRRYWKTTRGTQEALKDTHGIRIYRDSIRVLPYGEKGDDWLELERHYVAGGPESRRPRPVQTLGWVKISREDNPSLRDVANRQGLMDTVGFRELKRYCQRAMDFIAEVRRGIEPVVPRSGLTPEDKPEIDKALETIRGAISGKPDLLERFSVIENAVTILFEQAELTALYRDRLTAGLLTSIVMHDVGVPLRAATPLLQRSAAEDCPNQTHKRAFLTLSALVPKMNEGYLLLAGGLRSRDYRVRQLEVTEVLRVALAQMRIITGGEKVSIHPLESPGVIEAKIRRSDIWAIAMNLIANSIQASDYEHARGRSFSADREIVFSINKSNSDLVLTCEDNGPGLPVKPEGWIWEPFNSTKPNGSGMGLYIVSDIVAWYGGTKSASASTKFPTGALFQITIPRVIVNV